MIRLDLLGVARSLAHAMLTVLDPAAQLSSIHPLLLSSLLADELNRHHARRQ